MAPRIDLPDVRDGAPFTVANGLAHGVTRKRLAGRDLHRPIRGVRSPHPAADRRQFVRAAAARIRPWQAIAGSSAAVLWGLPVPPHLTRRDAVVIVAAPIGRGVPQASGFRGLRITPARLDLAEIDGVQVTDPVTTWCLLGREVGLADLVAAGDVLITPSTRTDRRTQPVALETLASAAAQWNRAPGGAILQRALPRLRHGVDSPMESLLRSAIVDAGLPEPTVHPPVVLRNGQVVHPDVGYPDLRVGVEYEGEGHADPRRMRADVARYEALAEVGWETVRVVPSHLFPDARDFVRRLGASLERAAQRAR